MAIEFIRAQMLTRGKSLRGAPAHMAYRSCSKVYDENADRVFDYTKKKSVLDAFLINAQGNTLEQLANKMEQAEKRIDAQVAREFILALPHELSLEKNREICQTFVNLMVEKFNIAAHVAIHKPDESRKNEKQRSDDSFKNVHAHITVTTRAIDSEGNIVGPKIRAMNDRAYLEGLKTQTRGIINQALKKEGFGPMEIRDPFQRGTKHLGPELTRMERRGDVSVKGDNNRYIEKINNIELTLKALAQEEEVLKNGKITLDGVTYKKYPYATGREVKPYMLAFKDCSELCQAIGEGSLRVKGWYDDKMIQSFCYQGQEITIAELTLINRGFADKILLQLEAILNSEGQKEVQNGRFIRPQRKQVYIPAINTDVNIAEAFWHAKQAACAMEENIKH